MCEACRQEQVREENGNLTQHALPSCEKQGWNLKKYHFYCHIKEEAAVEGKLSYHEGGENLFGI